MSSWASDASFTTTPVAGDQIEFVDTLTVGTDGVVSGADGNYTLRHIIAATGQVEAINYQVGSGTVATLSNPTATADGQNAADGTVDTNTQSGDLYVLATANATESAATIKAGGLSQAIAAQITQSVSLSGLDAGTQYYLHYVQVTEGNNSNVVTSAAITTDAAPVIASATFTYTRGNNYTTRTLVDPVEDYLFVDWSATPLEGEQLTTQTSAGTFDENGNFATDVEAEIPVTYTELDGTTWSFTIDTTGLGEAVDTTPADFTFTALTNQARDVLVTSNTITIQDVDAGADVPLTISGDATSEYSISTDGGATWGTFAEADTVVHLNDQVRLRHRTGNDYSDTITTTVDIGGRARNFTSTTLADTVKPTISLVGGNQSIVQGETWVDPGYTASDNADGDITMNVVVTGTVDTGTIGQYTLTYSVTDSSGNTAQTTRTVSVVEFVPDDQTAPVISLVGGNRTLTVGDTWTDPGYSATDDVDGDLTEQVTITGTVNTSQAGSYNLVYSVTDAAGNEGSTSRTVTVLPATQYPLDVLAPPNRTYIATRAYRIEAGERAFVKQPGEILDYDFDLSEWLTLQGDDLSEDVLVTAPAGVEIVGQGRVPGEDRVKVWLSEGSDGYTYPITLTMTTTSGRTAIFKFRLLVLERLAA
ncbi:DUF5011 domain-containing protein [Marinobacter sp. OP 3.4]|uniref:DUF5011 domain-containing protein n=1 Tax=Marinobacter sp. OP 3.4 TaxID=3076501 RepID=UPI002E2301CC